MNTAIVDSKYALSQPLLGDQMEFGDHFFAHSFHHGESDVSMKPLLMFDHFWMKRDTFGWHPHKGISAVTYLFEDSKNAHHNSDSMGNNLPITPGSLHWMVAGAGAQHWERPEGPDALVHGLQFFVDLPAQSKSVAPYAIHLESRDVPEVTEAGARIRVVAGEFACIKSPVALPQPYSLYDVHLPENGTLSLPLPANWGAWLYVVRGAATVGVEDDVRFLTQYQAVGLQTDAASQTVSIQTNRSAQLVVLAGENVPAR